MFALTPSFAKGKLCRLELRGRRSKDLKLITGEFTWTYWSVKFGKNSLQPIRTVLSNQNPLLLSFGRLIGLCVDHDRDACRIEVHLPRCDFTTTPKKQRTVGDAWTDRFAKLGQS